MAEVSSGYMNGRTSGSGDVLRVSWWLISQSIENNTSTIRIKVAPSSWEDGWAEVRTTTVSRDSGAAWVLFDTSTRRWRNYDKLETPVWIGQTYYPDVVISHNNDGTRTLSLGAGLAYDDLGYHEIYGSWELPRINRGLVRLQPTKDIWKTGMAYIKTGDNWKLGQVFINTPSGWKRGI